jgi:hypothetical protein
MKTLIPILSGAVLLTLTLLGFQNCALQETFRQVKASKVDRFNTAQLESLLDLKSTAGLQIPCRFINESISAGQDTTGASLTLNFTETTIDLTSSSLNPGAAPIVVYSFTGGDNGGRSGLYAFTAGNAIAPELFTANDTLEVWEDDSSVMELFISDSLPYDMFCLGASSSPINPPQREYYSSLTPYRGNQPVAQTCPFRYRSGYRIQTVTVYPKIDGQVDVSKKYACGY